MVWILVNILMQLVSLSYAYPVPVDFSGKLLRWSFANQDQPVLYEVISADGMDHAFYASIVEDAALIWSAVPNSNLRLSQAELSENAHITLIITSNLGDAGGFSSGFSVFDKSKNDGTPVHCRIEVLPGTSYTSFAKTILHELGHCIGLGHSLIPQAIMSYNPEENSYGLDTDDRAAITRLYPADGSKPKLPPGCSVQPSTQTGQPFAFLTLLLPVVLILFKRQRVTKPTSFVSNRILGNLTP